MVVAARDAERRLDNLTGTYPDACLAVELDITDRHQATVARSAALERFGRIDVLLNKAGVNQASTLEDISEEQLRDVMEVNLFGTLNVTRAFTDLARTEVGACPIHLVARRARRAP